MISEAFRKAVLPYLLDFGKVVFWCSTIYGIYFLIRRQVSEGTDRIKWAALGYICLRLINAFTNLVDSIGEQMSNIKF